MFYAALACHTEQDRYNKNGFMNELQPEQQTFDSLKRLPFNFFEKITWFLRIGDSTKDYLIKECLPIFEKNSEHELGLHVHSEKWDKMWVEDKKMGINEKLDLAFQHFRPQSIVFGKWYFNISRIKVAEKYGIRFDGSFIHQKIIAKPFLIGKVLEIPPSMFSSRIALDPVTSSLHLKFFEKVLKHIVKMNNPVLFHLYFHSYDLFKYNPLHPNNIAMRNIKQVIKLLKNNGFEFVNFSDIGKLKDDVTEIKSFQLPFHSHYLNAAKDFYRKHLIK